MYAVLPYSISRPTLITPDECTAKLPNASLDSAKWKAAIELAEIRYVEPILGWNLYTDICTNKNALVTSGNIVALQAIFTAQFGYEPDGTTPKVVIAVGQTVNSIDLVTVSAAYKNLWNNALWNYVFNCVYLVAIVENYAQFTSSGVQKANPLDSAIGTTSAANVGISLNDLRFLNDKLLLDRVNPLQDYLEKWICVNITQLPLYPVCKCQDRWEMKGGEIVSRTTQFINIYEDEDNNWHKGWWDNNWPIPSPTPTPVPVTATCSIILTIATSPNGTLFLLCNLNTISAQYVPGMTLFIPDLVGKNVNAIALYNGGTVTIGVTNTSSVIGYTQATGIFDRTLQGGFNDGDTFVFDYTETM